MFNDQPRVILYILRRDVRLSDNPAFHHAAQQLKRANATIAKSSLHGDGRSRDDSLTSEHGDAPFTHLLPVYVFPANQIESSGFLSSPSDRNPYPEARSELAKVWRTGPHRAKFIGEAVWDLKQQLENLNCGTGLEMRVGMIEDVVCDIVESFPQNDSQAGGKPKITGIWMTDDDGCEEKDDERAVAKIAAKHNIPFKIWVDEKFYVDECVTSAFVFPELYAKFIIAGIFHTNKFQNCPTSTPHIGKPSNHSGIDHELHFLYRHNFRRSRHAYRHKKRRSRFQARRTAS
jgi:deoxyribodipyrimidine photo-lyase